MGWRLDQQRDKMGQYATEHPAAECRSTRAGTDQRSDNPLLLQNTRIVHKPEAANYTFAAKAVPLRLTPIKLVWSIL